MGKLTDFNTSMTSMNTSLMRLDAKKKEARLALIGNYIYALRTQGKLPDPVVPVHPRHRKYKLRESLEVGREYEREKNMKKFEEKEFAQFRSDFESGNINLENAIAWLESLK